MPTLLEVSAVRSPQALAWTREDCGRMEAMGLLPARWELVRGEVISKMGQKLPHGRGVARLMHWLGRVFGEDHVVSQVTIDVSPADNPTSEPEPDIVVLGPSAAAITGNPGPGQIVLLVEVADTTLRHDLEAKAPLYAAAGIPEYWVLDVRNRRLHRHRQPLRGAYREIDILEDTERIAAPGHSRKTATVANLLD